MSKYEALKRYLQQCDARQQPMTFAEIEQVLGDAAARCNDTMV